MKKILVTLIITALAAVFVSCGATAMSPEARKFIKEYEAFVDDFCKISEQIKGASMMQKLTLSQKMLQKAQGLQKYTNRGDHLKAGLTPAGEKKIDKIGAKADKCSKNFKM